MPRQAESESSWKEDPWIDTDPWKQEDPLQKEDPWKKEQAEDWKQNGSYTEVNDKDKDHSHWQADPWIVNDPWDQGKEKKDSRQEDPWVDGHDPWKKGAQGWSNSRPQGKKGNAFMQSIQKVISQPTPNHNRAQRATKAAKADQAELEVDPIFENDPWSKEGKKSTEDEVGRPLQPWQPEKAPKDPEAKQKLFLEAALGPLDGPPEKWDQFKVNNELFGVTSTYDETLYTTKLDMSQVRPEVVQKAETVSREIAAAQVESISSEDEEAHFAAVPRAPPAPRAPRRFHDQGSGPQLQDQSKIDLLNALISQKKPNFETDADGNAAVQAVLVRVQAAVTAAKLDGAVKTFGSCATPLKSSGSDLDLAYTGTIKDPSPTGQVSYLASMVNPLKDLGFQDITKVFSSSTPLLKFFDPDGQLEVDFLIKNDLGIRNSHLLDTYCRCDPRVPVLGRLVKDWAKCHELVSVPDGCLNSYAYMLMVIHYLQSLQPPVVPNLQQDWPEWETDSHPVSDLKWGMENICETRFFDKVDELRRNPSANDTSDAELLIGFFNYYGWVFDWSENAVCIRLNGPGRFVDKFSLHPRVADAEQWHIEDPFDVRHNLAKHCTAAGRKRILRAMRHASSHLASAKLTDVCGPKAHRSWFLKCKVDASLSAEALLEKFSGYELLRPPLRPPQRFASIGPLAYRIAVFRRRLARQVCMDADRLRRAKSAFGTSLDVYCVQTWSHDRMAPVVRAHGAWRRAGADALLALWRRSAEAKAHMAQLKQWGEDGLLQAEAVKDREGRKMLVPSHETEQSVVRAMPWPTVLGTWNTGLRAAWHAKGAKVEGSRRNTEVWNWLGVSVGQVVDVDGHANGRGLRRWSWERQGPSNCMISYDFPLDRLELFVMKLVNPPALGDPADMYSLMRCPGRGMNSEHRHAMNSEPQPPRETMSANPGMLLKAGSSDHAGASPSLEEMLNRLHRDIMQRFDQQEQWDDLGVSEMALLIRFLFKK
ncbi:UTP:RNA uridylyltransferase 1 [Durusdinium trenchii]|uniref:UTP:RNA uridylyltransferase 1 n=1 Tax=Durusdinium trenchii TaxID=1381693 RepID=A0ABP0KYC3_9DINO